MQPCDACALREFGVVPKKVKTHVPLTGVYGFELTEPAETTRAISRFFKARYGDACETRRRKSGSLPCMAEGGSLGHHRRPRPEGS